MLIPLFLVGGLTVGSYAFLPSTWQKTRHRMGRRNRWREGTLYLTFDDGPHPEYTPILLDLLASYHIPATFFVVTEFARKNPALIQRMQAEGHLIGFHSASHRSAYLMTPKQTRSDFSLIHQRFTPVFRERNTPLSRQSRTEGHKFRNQSSSSSSWTA